MATSASTDFEVKAKPGDLPKEIILDATKMASLEDKITISNITLPKGVEFADKEIDLEQAIAILNDPAAEAAAREAEDSADVNTDAASVPSDNGQKPEAA